MLLSLSLPLLSLLKQVSPTYLENVLLTHPAIADAGVIGLPDLRAGELPAALVVLKAGVTATEAEIKGFVDGVCMWGLLSGVARILH